MNPRAMQPKSETEVFEDTEEQYKRRGGMAPRDVMPEDLALPKRPMRMPPKEVRSKVPVKKMMGGKAKGYAGGGVTRADGCITKGHTRGAKR